jgi:hypothetical protein
MNIIQLNLFIIYKKFFRLIYDDYKSR